MIIKGKVVQILLAALPCNLALGQESAPPRTSIRAYEIREEGDSIPFAVSFFIDLSVLATSGDDPSIAQLYFKLPEEEAQAVFTFAKDAYSEMSALQLTHMKETCRTIDNTLSREALIAQVLEEFTKEDQMTETFVRKFEGEFDVQTVDSVFARVEELRLSKFRTWIDYGTYLRDNPEVDVIEFMAKRYCD